MERRPAGIVRLAAFCRRERSPASNRPAGMGAGRRGGVTPGAEAINAAFGVCAPCLQRRLFCPAIRWWGRANKRGDGALRLRRVFSCDSEEWKRHADAFSGVAEGPPERV